jgi:formate/nitrite transporter
MINVRNNIWNSMSPILNHNYDPKLTHNEVGAAISHLGIKKANTKVWQLFLLGILAGMYVSFGSHLFLVAMEQGLGRIVAGACFSVGLVLIVIAGAELFTGNITMVVGSISGLYSPLLLFKNWIVVYLGNFAGAVLTAYLIWKSGIFGHPNDISSLGKTAMSVADYKLNLTISESIIRGIFCNILVIIAIIMSFFSKDVISKIVCIILPIMTFVGSGFEHSIANMYLIPVGLLIKGYSLPQTLIMFQNVIPVTCGNIVGGLFILLIHPNRIRQVIALFTQKRGH